MAAPKVLNARGWRVSGCMEPAYRALMGYPRRQSVTYTCAESRDILAQFALGFTPTEIAEWHERTANGVFIHLYRMGAFPPGDGEL